MNLQELRQQLKQALLNADSNMSYISCRHGHNLQQASCPIDKDELYNAAIECRRLYDGKDNPVDAVFNRLDAAEKLCRLANDFEQRRIDDFRPLVTKEEDALRMALKEWQGVE